MEKIHQKNTFRQLKNSDIPKLRKHLLKKQGNVCAICKRIPKKPCLDHEHVKKIKGTGQIRGVLCNSCNILIAKSENNCTRYSVDRSSLPTIFRAMADYLEQPKYPYIHPSEKPKDPILTKTSFNKLAKAYDGRAKFPEYRTSEKGKPLQKLTKKLSLLFEKYGIKPTFYKK